MMVALEAVLEDALDKMTLTAKVSADHGLRAVLPTDTMRKSMDDRKSLEHSFQQLLKTVGSPRANGNAGPDGEDDGSNGGTKALIAKYHGMRKTMDDAVKVNEKHSTLVVAEFAKERSMLVEQLERALVQVRDCKPCSRLADFVKDEREHRQAVERLEKSLADYQADVKLLEAAVARGAHGHRDKETQMKDQNERMKERLRELKSQIVQDNVNNCLQAEAAFQSRRRANDAALKQLLEQRKKVQQQCETENLAWQHTQAFMQRKIARAEQTLEEWTVKHEADVSVVVQKLQRMSDTREHILDELRATQEQYEQELQRKQQREDTERKLLEQQRRRNAAAVDIQRLWRGFRQRKRFKTLKKEAAAAKKGAKANGKGKAGKK